MAVSVFNSSSKRGTYCSSSTTSSSSKERPGESSGKKIPVRRSRSMASLPRSDDNPTSKHLGEYANTRDNPLFGCSSSSSSPEIEHTSEAIKGDVFDCKRGRSMWRNSYSRNGNSCSKSQSGRSLSRDVIGRRRLRSLSRGRYGVSEIRHWDDRISTDSLSETDDSSTRNYFQSNHLSPDSGSLGIYEMVQSEAQSTVSEVTTDHENAINKKNPSIIFMDNISDMGSELVNPDGTELVSDIRREYAIKLEQSQERIRKLQADLAVEEQRRQELSRILKDMVHCSKNSETCKSRAKRKASIERIKMSRRLAEEAMNYFDECVSLSTFDGSDFSSQEDQHTSNLGVMQTGNSRFFSNGRSNFSASNYPSSQFEHHEGSNNEKTSLLSITESDYAINRSGNDDYLPELDTPLSGNRYFSFVRDRTVGIHEIRNYMNFEEKSKCGEDVKKRSSYNAEDHNLNFSPETVLFEKVTLKNRIDFGGLLICNIRIF
ncbi:hypothetical protein Cni_G20787 [Canna indica]|uniref:Uncharacterized protein n=1 Tax=Canna indica TaxID=4628 RepID=A0AAQ3KRW9_9LILI|nr:hypothetical protein Cni_G20787 [Canna indica]